MKKSILIALCLAGSGLLIGCVMPDDLNSITTAPTSTKGVTHQK